MKILSALLILLSTLILWLTLHQYFFCPRFSFVETEPFHGNKIYNPYEGIDSSDWVMGNFHAHSNAWSGVTNGKGTPTDIANVYDSLGYGVHLVSDYHKVDRTNEYESDFISAYEHGYNLKKVHYLVLGSQKVSWLDYPLPQILSNKQWILNQLAPANQGLIILNHPGVRNGFDKEDLKYLTNYQCLEVLGPFGTFTDKWDASLSAGRPIFSVGNDDVHDVFDIGNVGNYCTWINAPTPNKNDVLSAMRNGTSYAMQIPRIDNETLPEKIKRFKTNLPRLNSFRVKQGTIHVSLNRRAKNIVFSGKQGEELLRTTETNMASYAIAQTDPYVRTTITFHDGTLILLNPVFRYDALPFDNNQPEIDHVKSNFLSFIGILILLLWALLIYHLMVSRYVKRRIYRLPAPSIRFFQG